MPSQFSKAGEERFVCAVRDVTASIAEGISPEDAIVKVAEDYQYGVPMAENLVRAYNMGRAAFPRGPY